MSLPEDLQKTLGDFYTLERELGGGGMARVFVARDVRLGRAVVVKMLSPEFGAGLSVDRFRQEIRLAASLQQANIVPVLAAGDSNGLPYYLMPLVEGETLRAHMGSRAPLPTRESISILRDVARALAFAHQRGVVHRDIKPENVLLSGTTAVVTDFGIAKALAASRTDDGTGSITRTGVALGTPAYIAPEQAAGDSNVGVHADLYALGVVAYELLCGVPPFTGKSAAALFAAHIAERPADLGSRRPDLPRGLTRLVMRCLEKEPTARPASADEFLATLDTIVITGETTASELRHSTTIAVMPFANMSLDPDAEFFSEGMSEDILNALVRVPGLRVIARTSSFALKGRNIDVREIGRTLGAEMIVDGSVRKAADRIRISAQLIDASNGHQLWSGRYDRELKDVFAVQDEITAAVCDELSASLTGAGALARPKPVIEAEEYELFLRARHLMNKPPEGVPKGRELLAQVLERAPGFAPAYTELATSTMLLGNFGILEPAAAYPKADQLAREAARLDPGDPIPDAALGHNALFYHYDWDAARAHFERAIRLGPNHPEPTSWMSFYWSSIGRHEEAVSASRKAVGLDPLNMLVRFIDVFAHHFARRYDEVVRLSEQMSEIDPSFSECYRVKSYALLRLGRIDEALASAEMSARLSNGHPYHRFHVAIVKLEAGDRGAAERLANEFISAPGNQAMLQLLIGNLMGPLGRLDEAFEWLDRYARARGHWMAMLRTDPMYDPVRHDPRFEALAARIGVPSGNIRV